MALVTERIQVLPVVIHHLPKLIEYVDNMKMAIVRMEMVANFHMAMAMVVAVVVAVVVEEDLEAHHVIEVVVVMSKRKIQMEEINKIKDKIKDYKEQDDIS